MGEIVGLFVIRYNDWHCCATLLRCLSQKSESFGSSSNKLPLGGDRDIDLAPYHQEPIDSGLATPVRSDCHSCQQCLPLFISRSLISRSPVKKIHCHARSSDHDVISLSTIHRSKFSLRAFF